MTTHVAVSSFAVVVAEDSSVWIRPANNGRWFQLPPNGMFWKDYPSDAAPDIVWHGDGHLAATPEQAAVLEEELQAARLRTQIEDHGVTE